MKKAVKIVATSFALLALSQIAHAQWSWKDDAGHTVFSDQPPPPTIPPSHILKRPGGSAVVLPSSADSGNAAADSAAKPKSLADQNLEFAKRQKDAADAAKKTAEEQAKQKSNAERCASAQQSLNALQSGQRMATVDSQGGRSYLDDSQRQAEIARVQASMAGC